MSTTPSAEGETAAGAATGFGAGGAAGRAWVETPAMNASTEAAGVVMLRLRVAYAANPPEIPPLALPLGVARSSKVAGADACATGADACATGADACATGAGAAGLAAADSAAKKESNDDA